jgi:hypothetical protein
MDITSYITESKKLVDEYLIGFSCGSVSADHPQSHAVFCFAGASA